MTATLWYTGTSNAVTTTLDGSITDTDETIALTSSAGLNPSGGVVVVDRIDANNTETPLLREYISFTGISGNSLTGCDRSGLGGSTAQSHSSGAKVEEVWTITHWNDFLEAFIAEHSTDGVHVLSDYVTLVGTETMTNKRITKRVTSLTSSATPTINTDNCDAVDITALATAINTMTTNLSGTPTNFQTLVFRIKDNGTARAITWGASFEAKGVALPTTTVPSKVLTVGFIYDTTTSKWGCIASASEA